MTTSIPLVPKSHIWQWQGQTIRYQTAGCQGMPIILIHGFGASSDHWRHNLPVLAATNRVYAIDLLGFGQSAKPTPGKPFDYTFSTWGDQIAAFCQEVVGDGVVLVGNSIGCIVALQTAVTHPQLIHGIGMINCSLRMLHDRKLSAAPWYRRIGSRWLQQLLSIRPLGHFFFRQIAQPQTIKKILLQAYGHPEAVTDELVDLILQPARDAGAADVFLAFITYSPGPLPEDLLPQISCPILILWGTADPWEPINLGQQFSNYASVNAFIPLEGAGHCPHDEKPEQVNSILIDWIRQL